MSQAGFGGSLKPRKHEQRLLRNMGVHKVGGWLVILIITKNFLTIIIKSSSSSLFPWQVVLDLLQIPYDQKEDVRYVNKLF